MPMRSTTRWNAARSSVHHHGLDHVLEDLDLVVGEALAQPEVEERDVAAGAEQVVARMRIAVEGTQLVDAPEREPVQALGGELTLLVRPADDLGERCALGELRGEHTARRQVVDHRRHVDVRMPPVVVHEQALVGSPRCGSRAPRPAGPCSSPTMGLGSMPGNSIDMTVNSRSVFSRSAATAWSTPGYWTLTATSRPSWVTARCTWPMDAAASGTGSHTANTRSGASPSSARITCATSSGAMGGASACNCASASRTGSGRPWSR